MSEKFLAFLPIGLLSLAQILLKRQASFHDGLAADRRQYLSMLALSPGMWLAVALAGCAFIAWMLLLQRHPLSHVYPLVSLSFPLVALLGYVFLGERINAMQAIGLALIVAGVALSIRYGIAGT